MKSNSNQFSAYISGILFGLIWGVIIALSLNAIFGSTPEPEIVEKRVPVAVPYAVEVPTQVIVELNVSDPVYETYEVTAYTAGPESTGKTPDHPAYGITASGEHVRENHTLACPKSLPFGTRVKIPYFNNVFICEDRGGAITEGKLDVYIPDLDEARAFGRRMLDVKIIEEEIADE